MVKSVIVVGAGQMGAGIAQVAAQTGLNVTIFDSFPGAQERATQTIQKSLAKLNEKKLLTETPDAVFARVKFVSKVEDLKTSTAELLIEAVTENFELKADLFRKLDETLNPSCIFASNTSSIGITRLAAVTKRADKFMGMHFMNPVPLMKLVELISGLQTSDATLSLVTETAKRMGKTTILSQDRPGFIVNRILMTMINEAVLALGENLGSRDDIDTGMKLGTNQPMGPLELADFIGLDTCLSIMNVLYDGFGDSKYRPAPLLQNYVAAGWLGRKTKRGFYTY